MEIKAVSSFFESFSKLRMYESWWYKIYETIRYNIPRFFQNIYIFRNELYEFRDWQYSFNLKLFKKSLERTCLYIEVRGNEEDISKGKKVKAMKRAIEILNNFETDNFLEQAETKLGYEFKSNFEFVPIEEKDENGENLYQLKSLDKKIEKSNRKLTTLSRKLEVEQWDELWKLIIGQDYTKFKISKSKDYNKLHDEWLEQFDGSGMRGWWD